MQMWAWIAILVVLLFIYGGSYTLVRTSGDGRSALRRILHPGHGGLQPEYGGDGQGNRIEADAPLGDVSSRITG
jgi:hypothetical protein